MEATLVFIYKTIKAYCQYQDYIEQKLEGKFVKNKVMDGYLINQEYINYWKKYSDFEDLKNLIQSSEYRDIRSTLYKYRKSNKYQQYQPDAVQIIYKTPEDFTRAIKKQNHLKKPNHQKQNLQKLKQLKKQNHLKKQNLKINLQKDLRKKMIMKEKKRKNI